MCSYKPKVCRSVCIYQLLLINTRTVPKSVPNQFVILTDILGGTPTTASLALPGNKKVQVVTGVNMPMLLKLSSYRHGRSLLEIAKLVKKSGRRRIPLAKIAIESIGLKRRKHN